MNIDQQIREILSRNYPVNDNQTAPQASNHNIPTSISRSISIVGNNNIIISSNVLTLGLFLLLNAFGLLYLLH